MAERTLSGRYEPPVEQPRYRVTGRIESLLQPRIADHRLFLALRNAGYSRSFRPDIGRTGSSELREQQMGYEGC